MASDFGQIFCWQSRLIATVAIRSPGRS